MRKSVHERLGPEPDHAAQAATATSGSTRRRHRRGREYRRRRRSEEEEREEGEQVRKGQGVKNQTRARLNWSRMTS